MMFTTKIHNQFNISKFTDPKHDDLKFVRVEYEAHTHSVIMSATDRYVLVDVALPLVEPGTESFTGYALGTDLALLHKVAKGNTVQVTPTELSAGGLTIPLHADVDFPAVDRLWPKPEELSESALTEWGVNPRKLDRFRHLCPEPTYAPVRLLFNPDSAPVVVLPGGSAGWRGPAHAGSIQRPSERLHRVDGYQVMNCCCATNRDGTVTTSRCPSHADQDPCLTMSWVTGKRRKGTIRRGTCTNCGWEN